VRAGKDGSTGGNSKRGENLQGGGEFVIGKVRRSSLNPMNKGEKSIYERFGEKGRGTGKITNQTVTLIWGRGIQTEQWTTTYNKRKQVKIRLKRSKSFEENGFILKY